MDILVLVARFLFSMIFLFSGLGHFTQTEQMAQFAATKKVPAPKLGVIVTGIMLVIGGLSVLLGAYVEIGALLIVVFLVPTSFLMHNFCTVKDPMMKQNDMIMFMKNMALTGAAILIWYLYKVVPNVPLSIN